jgi:hypothetical protein
MPRQRVPSAPSRAIRTSEVRRTNYEEHPQDGHHVLAWGEDADGNDIELSLEAGAPWGPQFLVTGYERIHLALDVDFGDVGNDMTTAFVIAQGSFEGGLLDEQWFDLHADEASDGVLVQKVWEIGLTAGANARTGVAWHEQRRVLRYMRLKVYVDGTAFTGSSAKLKASRVMDSM